MLTEGIKTSIDWKKEVEMGQLWWRRVLPLEKRIRRSSSIAQKMGAKVKKALKTKLKKVAAASHAAEKKEAAAADYLVGFLS
ncbi:unnamed protein product [Linum trigynum]|uniref:Uncharacterized protein n=1 Tax=Linum trigynum TaxID=586398 RepID=A0AAV2GPQ7_9ROSI